MKRTAAIIAALALALAVSGCSANTTDSEGNQVERFEDNSCRFNIMNIVVDRETGVEYLIVEGMNNEMAICPLFEADGTLSTSDEGQ